MFIKVRCSPILDYLLCWLQRRSVVRINRVQNRTFEHVISLLPFQMALLLIQVGCLVCIAVMVFVMPELSKPIMIFPIAFFAFNVVLVVCYYIRNGLIKLIEKLACWIQSRSTSQDCGSFERKLIKNIRESGVSGIRGVVRIGRLLVEVTPSNTCSGFMDVIIRKIYRKHAYTLGCVIARQHFFLGAHSDIFSLYLKTNLRERGTLSKNI